MTIERKLAKRLRALRKKASLTQEQVAETAGIDYKFYQSLEGKDPPSATIRTLEKLSRALKVDAWKMIKF